MATKTVAALNAPTKLELRDVCFAGVTNTMTGSTPSVTDKGNFKTANTSSTVINDFTGGVDGQRISVMINDANTTLDFTTSSLIGNGGADWSPSIGDSFTAVRDASGDWWCQILESSGTGEVNTARSDGTGEELTKTKDGVILPFKTLIGGLGVSLSSDANTVTITNDGGIGEVNTSSNTGAGAEIAKAKSTYDLPFRTLVAGTDITITENTDTITIDFSASITSITYVDNTSATGITVVSLPTATKGIAYIIERVATYAYRVDPNGTEYFAGSTAGKYKSLDSDGTYMKIECLRDGIWHVTAQYGVVTDE